MRKFILFSLVSISSHLMAQKSFFGVDAGVNVASQRTVLTINAPGSTVHSTSSGAVVIKPIFGVFYQRGFSKNMGVRLDAQYMGMGTKANGFQTRDIEINYLTLPLTIHYSVKDRLSFNAGPYLSFTLGGTRLNNEPVTKTFHQNDRGFRFGGAYEFYKNISVNINYVLGLMNVWLADTSTDNVTNTTYHTKVMNRALQFSLIYKFSKNSK